ncbi:hypothetical protein [Azospirillum sp. B506]|uniref:hypothetical protein n=1 Tax=Azospirillum sp. B506 TaxID=137721 RepID=UPI0011DC95D8|nr:hypothetical protein [Azospirillum sp. B506]
MGVLLAEQRVEEGRSFGAWKSKKPFSDKADLFLKTMNSTIAEVMSQRCGIMIGCQGLSIPKHTSLLLRHRLAWQPGSPMVSAIGAIFLQIGHRRLSRPVMVLSNGLFYA